MSKRRNKSYSEAEGKSGSAIMPSRYDADGYRLVKVFVEGYNDVSFWRGIFDDYETDSLKFEISVPPRQDLAKGKRVLLEMIPQSGPDAILCVDSDFDYIFDGHSDQSRLVLESKYMFHTYAYATENYLCYPPSLHGVCVKSTKNDTYIFDFEKFFADYSRTIYPLFLWYAYSARQKSEKAFALNDFRSSIRLNYLDLENNGENTISWLGRQVQKRIHILMNNHGEWAGDVRNFGQRIERFGVTTDNVYMYMQGHTLMDNVVITVLHTVCDKLREMAMRTISEGTKQGMALKNELSNYNNALRNVREVLLDNEAYKDSPQYLMLRRDIENYIGSLE